MPWLKLRELTIAALIEQGADPAQAGPAGMMARQARDTSKIIDCGKPMIIGFRACALSRHARHIPIAGRSKSVGVCLLALTEFPRTAIK